MRGERALITGGAGAVGSNIADQLVRAGAKEIVVLDNFVRGRRENLAWALANGPVRLVEGDIRDRELVDRLTRGIDVVFHQAALRITQCAEEPRLALEVMVDGTYNVIEAALRERASRRIVAASSASVYGLAEEFPTGESHHPYANDTLYGAAKTFNEGLLRSFHSMQGLDYVALRYFNVYGPRMDIHGVYTEVLVRWMERIEDGRAPLILGDGSQTMDFVYIEDVARANLLAAAGRLHRHGLQRRQRRRDEPAGARTAAGRGDGLGRFDRIRPGALRQQGSPAALGHGPRARAPRLRGARSTSSRGCGGWSTGGAPNVRRRRLHALAHAVNEIPITRPHLTGGEGAAVAEAIASGWVSQGPRVREFEDAFAARVGAAAAVATTSCTTALALALHVSGVGPGDEVIVPSLSFIATANAVWQCGAQPVFADVDPRTYNLDPAAAERAITPRTKVVMPVHQVGLPADMDAFYALAERHERGDRRGCRVRDRRGLQGTADRLAAPRSRASRCTRAR